MSDLDAVNIALLLLRVSVGATFIAHGWNHIFGGGKIEGTAGWFESLGMKPGRLHAWAASLVEFGAGALLVLGLLTSLAAAGVVGVMLVAWMTNHLRNGFFIFRPGEGWEYVMNLTIGGIALSALGAGQLSLDHVLEIDYMAGSVGLLIGLGAGLGGGAALLAVFWQPVESELLPEPEGESESEPAPGLEVESDSEVEGGFEGESEPDAALEFEVEPDPEFEGEPVGDDGSESEGELEGEGEPETEGDAAQ